MIMELVYIVNKIIVLIVQPIVLFARFVKLVTLHLMEHAFLAMTLFVHPVQYHPIFVLTVLSNMEFKMEVVFHV